MVGAVKLQQNDNKAPVGGLLGAIKRAEKEKAEKAASKEKGEETPSRKVGSESRKNAADLYKQEA